MDTSACVDPTPGLPVCTQVSWAGAAIVAAAAVVANTAESYLGAVVQGKVDWLTNDTVNMLQITLAAALAVAMQQALAL